MTENKLIKNLEEELSKSADKKRTLANAVYRNMNMIDIRETIEARGLISKELAEYFIYLCGCLELESPEAAKSVADAFSGKTYLQNLVSFDLPEAPGLQAEIMSRVGKTNLLEVQIGEVSKSESGLEGERDWTTTSKDLMIDGKYFGTLGCNKNGESRVVTLDYNGFIPNLERVAVDDLTDKQEIERRVTGEFLEIGRARYADFYAGPLAEVVWLSALRKEENGPLVRADAFTEGSLRLRLE